MRVVITGGSGFIGSHVVDHLCDAGHDVAVIDLRPPHRDDVGHLPVDIGDMDGLLRATEGADAVFHLAAVSDVNVVAGDPVLATDLNVLCTARVWDACRRNGVGRVVLASTVWVYAGAPGGAGDPPLEESSAFLLPGCGSHLYTSSKVAAELMAHSYHALYGQEFTILRYGIPYGPRMRDALVIPRFVRMALAGEPITIDGDGSQFRNYVYVEDLAAAHVLALGEAGANEVFNLEGAEPISVRYLIDSVAAAIGVPVEVVRRPSRPGDYCGREVSATKAERLLGWAPRVPFDEGLRRYVAWHRQLVPEPALAAAAAVPAVVLAAPDVGPPVLAPAAMVPDVVLEPAALEPAALVAVGARVAPPALATPPLELPALAPAAAVSVRPPVAATPPTPTGHGTTPSPGRVPTVAGLGAGMCLAVLLLPALATVAGGGAEPRLLTAAGTLLAAAMATSVTRRLESGHHPWAWGSILLVAVWLLSQAASGLVALPVGVLIGVAVGATVGLPPRAGWREAAGPGVAAVTVLTAIALVAPPVLFGFAAVLVVGAVLLWVMSDLHPPVTRQRRSWAVAGATLASLTMVTSLVGATSAGAAWFGNVVTHGPRTEGRVAITLDGHPDPVEAEQIISALDSRGVRATFFTKGSSLESRRDFTSQLIAAGQLIGNNAFSSDRDAFLNPRYTQLRQAQLAFERELGLCPTYFRPPGGRHTPFMALAARAHRMTMVTWDVRVGAREARRAGDPAALAQRVLSRVRPGSIVAFELGGSGTAPDGTTIADALPLVLDGLQARGLEPVGLDWLLHGDGYVSDCGSNGTSQS